MTNKLKYFVGNWKMFGDFSSFKIIYKINQFSRKSKSLFKKKIILCVPNTLIYFFKKKLKSKYISLGVQNCHQHQDYGPFTGSINASMLKKAGAEFIILGHSENRLEGETNKIIKKKIISSIKNKLNIIFCVGESLHDRKMGKTLSKVKKQIRTCLNKKISPNKIWVAYEPIWAIGTNKIPKKNELKSIFKFIKKELKNIYKSEKYPKVLYGGSVNGKNIKLFSLISEIDGFLIGGASQSSKKFIDIIKNYYK